MPETHFCHSLPLSVFFCLACDCSATTPGQTSIHKGVHAFTAGYVILPSCQGRERLSHHGTVPSGALLFAGRLRDWGWKEMCRWYFERPGTSNGPCNSSFNCERGKVGLASCNYLFVLWCSLSFWRRRQQKSFYSVLSLSPDRKSVV